MKRTLGIDLGGTKVEAGVVRDDTVSEVHQLSIRAHGSEREVLADIYSVVDRYDLSSVDGIGIGVPGTVHSESGVVFDIQNIPSWREVALRQLFQERYGIPTYVNNDSNCFALGELIFGKGRAYRDFAGITIGTGLGTGLIIGGQLYSGAHCGAGEFGMIPYRDEVLEYYASGSFFQNVFGVSGVEVFQRAESGDTEALAYYHQLGTHLGEALKILMYAVDPQVFILGGSVAKGFHFFEAPMREAVASFPYRNVLDGLTIEVSDLQQSAVLGAAALAMTGVKHKNTQ